MLFASFVFLGDVDEISKFPRCDVGIAPYDEVR